MPNVSKDTGEHVPTQAPELLDQHQTAERESGSQERLLANTIRINETISEVLNESAAGSNPFARYGLKFNADGSLDGPNRPSLYAQIPEILSKERKG